MSQRCYELDRALCACPESEVVHENDAALAGKATAMWFYAHGWTSLDATTATFARYPEWRHA